MSYRFTHVQRFKRQPSWPGGATRLCTRCGVERRRSRQVVVTANLRYTGTKFKVPVAYCEEHDPIAVPSPSDYADSMSTEGEEE